MTKRSLQLGAIAVDITIVLTCILCVFSSKQSTNVEVQQSWSLRMTAPLEPGIVCSDIDRMLDFYTRVLGLKLVADAETSPEMSTRAGLTPHGYRIIRLQTPYGERIKLVQVKNLHAKRSQAPEWVFDRQGIAYITFIVSNINDVAARLSKHGVKLVRPGPVEVRKGVVTLFAEDPEGNFIEFVEARSSLLKSHSPRPVQLNEWRQPENSPKQQDCPEFILGCDQMIQAGSGYGRSWKEPPWSRLSTLGSIGAASYQAAAMRRIAESHPNLTIVIGCLTQPTPTAESHLWRRWTEQLELSLLPSVYFGTASLRPYVAAEGYPFPPAGRYDAEAVRRIRVAKSHVGLGYTRPLAARHIPPAAPSDAHPYRLTLRFGSPPFSEATPRGYS